MSENENEIREDVKRARVNTLLKFGLILLVLFVIWYGFSLSSRL